MPRGKYPRKSAADRANDQQAQPIAKEIPPVEMPQAPIPDDAIPVQLVSPEFVVTPSFYRNKRVAVDGIGGDNLKAYARSIGISQRDVDYLTEARLRQNCKARILDSMED